MPRRTFVLLLAIVLLSACPDGAAEEKDADGRNGEAMTEGGHKHTNRLAREMSPYLLQHAHNPVDWYPWGDEAFAKAREGGGQFDASFPSVTPLATGAT